MPSFVRISFFPIKKDASPETIAQTLGAVGGKEKFLSSPGLLKAYYSTGLDPNEPPAIELVDGKQSRTEQSSLSSVHQES